MRVIVRPPFDLQRTAWLVRVFNPLVATKPEDGALPTLRAATDCEAGNGSFWGPSRFFELNGPPALACIPKRAQDEPVAARLWEVGEKLTGVTFDFDVALGASTQRAG